MPEVYLRLATGGQAADLQQADAQQHPVPQLAQLRSLSTRKLAIQQVLDAQGQRAAQQQQLQLSSFLPSLTQLRSENVSEQLLASIAGHSSIRSLSLQLHDMAPGSDFWATGGFLRSLPELQSLSWEVDYASAAFSGRWTWPALAEESAEGVVADAAGCAGLRDLHVVARDGLSVALCQQLAAGACTGLSSLYLQVGGVSLAMVAALVQGLKQLRRLEVRFKHAEHVKHVMEAVARDARELQALLQEQAQGKEQGAAEARVVQLATAVADSRELARAMVEAARAAGQQAGSGSSTGEAAAGQGKMTWQQKRDRAKMEKALRAHRLQLRKEQEQVVAGLEGSAAALLPLLAAQLGLPQDGAGGMQQGQQGASAAAPAQGRGARRKGQRKQQQEQQQQQLAPGQQGSSGQQQVPAAALYERAKDALLLGLQLLRMHLSDPRATGYLYLFGAAAWRLPGGLWGPPVSSGECLRAAWAGAGRRHARLDWVHGVVAKACMQWHAGGGAEPRSYCWVLEHSSTTCHGLAGCMAAGGGEPVRCDTLGNQCSTTGAEVLRMLAVQL